MASKSKGGELPQMDEVFHEEQTAARLGWFLSGRYPGAAKRKRIARDFDVSPDTVKGWLNGSRPAGRHFDAMVKKFGREFLRFVYPATADDRATELSEIRDIAARLARIEERVNAPMVGRDTAGLASTEGAEALPSRREIAEADGWHVRGGSRA